MLEPLELEFRAKDRAIALKTSSFVYLYKFSIICSLISTHKITKMYKVTFNDVPYLFIL
jgi:hypothetical protein